MTESGDNKNWNTKQNWIKDVLSKSGTELMEITTTSTKNGLIKKFIKKATKESPNKMVYYQSMPLIVKSEPTSQAEFCTPLVGGSTTTTTAAATTNLAQFQEQQQLQHQNVAHNYSIHSVNRSTMVIQQQQQTSINNINNNCNTNFLTTNIKTELLPPGLSVYAASTSAAATNHSSITPAITTINVSNNAPLTTATVSEIARKSATIKPQFKCEQCGMTFGSKSAHTSHTKSHAKSNSNNSSSNGELLLVNGGGGIANAQQQLMLAEVSSDVMQLSLGMPKTSLIKLNAAAGATVASASISNSGGTGDPYECNVCQKTFAVPARLIRHYRTHTGERPFECEFCHKLFSVKENLQVHRRIHTKERPYKCDVCGRAFEHSGKLHRHMRIHTGERPHKCSVCGKTFIQSGQLVIHMRTHTGEKPYKCPVEGCGKGFTCSKQLKVHSRTHTGEKPYHCDICFRDFGYNHVLKLHRVQHYGSKCYKCTICDETFKNKKEMEAHIKGHANELPDDEAEDESGASNSEQGSSNSSSLGDTTNSAPDSPQSPTSSLAATVTTSTETLCRNALKPKKNNAVKRMAATPLSPNSPGSSLSPLSSAVTRLSTASPNTLITSASASPALSLTHETEHTQQQQPQQQIYIAASTLYNDINGRNNAVAIGDELPTDLRVLQQQQQQHQHVSNMYQQRVATYTYVLHSPPPLAQILPKQQQQQLQQSVSLHELTATSTTAAATGPTINPALLEAASIAKRISHVNLAAAEEEEDAETQAALQIMQLNRAQQQQQQQQRHYQKKQVVSDLPHYDDTHEANELIEHYKRGELARHGLHKRYAAPVPKFETSLLHNEIVRQVEAAIAPLRSSTESPERSSSPESDSMMMADRDVMTLPLRKRKLYMNKGPTTGSSVNGLVTEVTNNTTAVSNIGCALTATNSGNMHGSSNELGNKVLRMSSVIQFAKASKKSVATKQN